MATVASRRAARRGSMGRSRRGRVASSGGPSSVVGESASITENEMCSERQKSFQRREHATPRRLLFAAPTPQTRAAAPT